MEAGKLRKDAIGLAGIVFMVIATNGPLTALVGALPTTIAVGNGAGAPAVIVGLGLLYLLFSVGFTAMSRHVKNAGAFYAYIANGLGRPMGVASAFTAIVAYGALQLALLAMMGFFLSQALQDYFNIHLSWWVSALITCAVIQYAGFKNIEVSGRILGILMVAEILVMLVFDTAVVSHGGGPQGLSFASFEPKTFMGPGFGAAVVFIIAYYTGFETTAIYAEEARDPTRTIPRATYAAILIITAFYALSSWAVVAAYGPSQVTAIAQKDPGNFWLAIATTFAGKWLADSISILMITSLLAALISFHNTISRYVFSLAREQLLWQQFAKTHKTQQTPYVASFVQSIVTVVILVLFGMSGWDPLLVVMTITAFVSSIGIVAVQALTGFSVVCFFWRDHRGVSIWQRLIAPLLSALGLLACLVLMLVNRDLLTGGIDTPVIRSLPWDVLAIGVAGFVVAVWCKFKKPVVYSNLGRTLN
ncbi:APC family permease [Paraburkholderia hospita]|uniref:APC family permease n=1 Tax=Paraburkholderia hospita TaxID=169430 RepID=UPI0002719348|nr:APC family permease [Paraburkholderia hospita]EUC20693.1 amino acid permease-associated region [Burkholderia sp. BT03]SKC45483.1 amino acid/polyamine/organocation transporter, APC superfamily [Paraburkholderia hospita]SKD04284.1 amino acid/polyamine/organocation transporter, APC superfamily [Paraburkholderia hospita]